MRTRRMLLGVAALTFAIHLVGMARALVPAQDGLKFIRVAREFTGQPFSDVVRGSDQHPLYPAAIAALHPIVAGLCGSGPLGWQRSAQLVSILAALAWIWPLFGLTRELHGERAGLVAVLLAAVLPATFVVGHETLSDALAACFFAWGAFLGVRALGTRRSRPALACGVACGLGYWTRPELALLPLTILGVGVAQGGLTVFRARWSCPSGHMPDAMTLARPAVTVTHPQRLSSWGGSVVLAASFLAIVGSYALVKGEFSEKLAVRRAADLPSVHDRARATEHWLPPGLDDPRWDFSPKEESGRISRPALPAAVAGVAGRWAGGLGYVFALAALVGVVRCRARSAVGAWLTGLYAVGFGAILVRHAMTMGYLSDRHALSLVLVSLPWAAAGACSIFDRLSQRMGISADAHRRLGWIPVAATVAVALALQAEPAHASRWGHRAAGEWLARHLRPGEAVLDTRGWAGFVSGGRVYDYWHVRQALTDARLAYVVVGEDELNAGSRRAATLRAMLAHAGRPVAQFPARRGDKTVAVRVYRFDPAASWEGLRP